MSDRADAGRIRLHLPEPEVGWRFGTSWCGQRRGKPEVLRDDPSEVTCQTCLNQLERDMNATLRVPSFLRSRAYGRATALLRERHRSEFDAILDEVLPQVVAEDWPAVQREVPAAAGLTPAEFVAAVCGGAEVRS